MYPTAAKSYKYGSVVHGEESKNSFLTSIQTVYDGVNYEYDQYFLCWSLGIVQNTGANFQRMLFFNSAWIL